MIQHEIVQEALTKVREVIPEKIAHALNGFIVLDVREPQEVLLGYLPGAVHVPRGTLEFRITDDGRFHDRAMPILVYSGTGERSALAALTLSQLGFSDVQSLVGGFSRWAQEDRPVE